MADRWFGWAWSFWLCSACALLLLAGGCDSIFGLGASSSGEDEHLTAPVPHISEFGFSPRQVFLGALEGENEDASTIGFEVAVRLRTPPSGSCVSRVEAVLVREGEADPVRGQAELPFVADSSASTDCPRGLFRDSLQVRIARGASGRYVLRAWTVGPDGQLGDRAEGLVHVRQGEGEPPRLESVTASADTIDCDNPPETLTFWAEATDPDGLANLPPIGGVKVTVPRFEDPLDMFDNGTRGDEEARDGRYTARFEGIDPSTCTNQEFRFQAVDRVGLTSEVIVKTIVIE